MSWYPKQHKQQQLKKRSQAALDRPGYSPGAVHDDPEHSGSRAVLVQPGEKKNITTTFGNYRDRELSFPGRGLLSTTPSIKCFETNNKALHNKRRTVITLIMLK